MPIAIEVPHRHGTRFAAHDKVLRHLEASIPNAQEHRDVVGASIGRGEVWRPIAIEVAHRNGSRITGSNQAPRSLEGAIPNAQKHRDVAVAKVVKAGHGKVWRLIAIEVAHRNGPSIVARSEKAH